MADNDTVRLNLSKAAAIVTILAVVFGFAGWLYAISATASEAERKALEDAAQLERKADRDSTEKQLQRIYDKLDAIDTYLRDHK